MDEPTRSNPPAGLPASADGVLGPDTFGRALADWAADSAVDDAARRRAEQRWLEAAAAQDATFDGALLGLAERGQPVSVEAGGSRIRGVIVGIGADFVALRSDQDQHALVRTDAIQALTAEPGAATIVDDATRIGATSLVGLLAAAAGDRVDVVVRTTAGAVVRGRLRSAGTDVVEVRIEGETPVPAWIPLGSVAVVVVDV